MHTTIARYAELRVPRYTSYPPASCFGEDVGAGQVAGWLCELDPQAPLSLYAWGLLPSAPAWVAVMMPPSAGLVIDGLLLAGGYLVDRRVYPEQGLADWLTLRFRLSMGAALCCFLGAAAT